jgi:hypothetical protein
MGPYLSTPIVTKCTAGENNKELRFVACDMQGFVKIKQAGEKIWRTRKSIESIYPGVSPSSACSTGTEV